MRTTPARRKKMLAMLAAAWNKSPRKRLTELLLDICSNPALADFYVLPDRAYEEMINNYIKIQPKKGGE